MTKCNNKLRQIIAGKKSQWNRTNISCKRKHMIDFHLPNLSLMSCYTPFILRKFYAPTFSKNLSFPSFFIHPSSLTFYLISLSVSSNFLSSCLWLISLLSPLIMIYLLFQDNNFVTNSLPNSQILLSLWGCIYRSLASCLDVFFSYHEQARLFSLNSYDSQDKKFPLRFSNRVLMSF